MKLPPLEKLNHATIITGNRQVNLKLVKNYLTEQGIQIEGNSDVAIFDQESIKVDMLRDEIIAFLSNQKVSAHRFVIISTDQFGTEAQNAFLKNLEEPHAGTYIIILISNEKKLLSTILSRSQIIQGEQHVGDTRLDVNEFLKKSIAEKFAYIESFTKSKKDEDNLSKTEVIHFIDALEKKLWETPSFRGGDTQSVTGVFTDIRAMREYANIRGASHRVILDYLAIMLS